jgi:hypothetical protein
LVPEQGILVDVQNVRDPLVEVVNCGWEEIRICPLQREQINGPGFV